MNNCPRLPGALCADATDVCCLDAPTIDTSHEFPDVLVHPETRGEAPLHLREPQKCDDAECRREDHHWPAHDCPEPPPFEPLDENVFAAQPCPTSGLPCGEAARLSPICCADVPPATEAATTFDGTMYYDVKPRYTDSATARSPVTLDLTVLSIDDLLTELSARIADEYGDLSPAAHLVRVIGDLHANS